ncbi:hypothetical protein [Chitinophaga nivalis]|uniref:SH3 domain-containing protein n=1 Tax=Chitinophaga nivalis TaxID=2991709 RepID=A0ABT3INY6_9BACT|nr:hypothetical protein [Chitinophaga nivalis]MCW3464809.1 hypothetical protein [Chitinophaga nivalis]MCW3485500.1 hypothetical protein [Chitinophaga nivalis]
MKVVKILAVFVASVLFFTLNGKAQDCNPYKIIKTLISSQEINGNFPIVDSLFPIQTKKKSVEFIGLLTKEEQKEFKKNVKATSGFKLCADSLAALKLIPAPPIFQALAKFDASSAKIIDNNKPFYLASAPVFFHNNTKAIIYLILVKGFGSIYILEKKGDAWVIVKEIYGWTS